MKSILPLIFVSIAFNCFSQNNIMWESPITVSAPGTGNAQPRIALDRDGNPLIIWGRINGNRLYFSKWNGSGFTTPVILNPTGVLVFTASWAGPSIASHGDTVYIAYKQTPEDVHPAFLLHSYDGGVTFSNPVQIDKIGNQLSRFPTVTTHSTGQPLVTFMKFNPGFLDARYVVTQSKDYGLTFETDQLASQWSGGDVCDCCPSTILSEGNTMVSLYRDNLNNQRTIYAMISNDGGANFNSGMEVDDTGWMLPACPSSGPDGVIIGDTLYSVFLSEGKGITASYLSRASLSTLKSKPTELLQSTNSGITLQNYPRIAHQGNSVGIVMQQIQNGNKQVAFAYYSDITNGKEPIYDVIAATDVANADIEMEGTSIHCVWQDNTIGGVRYRKGSYMTTGIMNNDLTALPKIQLLQNPVINQTLAVKISNSVIVKYGTISELTGSQKWNVYPTDEQGLLTFDIQNLPSGWYLLQLYGNEKYLQSIPFVKISN